MAFGLTPAGNGFPPQAPDSFPNYIQFQHEGTNLGTATVDTVDFTGSVFVSRGDGENSNKLTVVVGSNPSAGGGGGGTTEELVLSLAAAGAGTFNGVVFSNWTGTVLHSSADAAWNPSTQVVDLAQTGLYEVEIHGKIAPNSGTWPAAQGGFTFYGSDASPSVGAAVGGLSQSRHGMTVPVTAGWQAIGLYADFTDRYVVNVNGSPASITLSLYGIAYTVETDVANFTAVATIRRIGPAV